jgi:hypothetical protein
MELPNEFWIVFIANLPIVTVLFVAQQKKWLYLGVTVQGILESFTKALDQKDKDIDFREQLRQEAINDLKLREERDKEKTEAIRELTDVVTKTLDLNDRLLNETLGLRWDGNDRRTKTR